MAVRASERYATIAAADDSMSLFNRQAGDRTPGSTSGRMGSIGDMSDWQISRHVNRAPDLVSAIALQVPRQLASEQACPYF